jgi:L-ascorbate metabolism protein UlaG (beta-lactamase superfamily)
MLNDNNINIFWTGHDGFRLEHENKIIYIDPFKLNEKYNDKNDASIILITHNHFDHLSIEDINKIIKKDTKIICSDECIEILTNNYKDNEILPLKPKDKTTVENIIITGVEAYNTNKNFHPKEDKKVGYIITINHINIYHTGDTDLIPEMNNLTPDIAFVPVSGTYVMNAIEAAKATNELIKPKKIAIPMHYGSIVGTIEDAESFCNNVKICKTTILDKE